MKILEICPFIRFAMQIQFTPENSIFTTVDSRIFYILNGDGVIVINNEPHEFSDNTVILFQPGTTYQFLCSREISIISINFDYTSENIEHTIYNIPIKIKSHNLQSFPGVKRTDFENCDYLNSPIIIPNAIFLSQTLYEITSEFSTKLMYFHEKNSALLKSCIVNLVRKLDGTPTGTGKIDRVIAYIHENYSSCISNEVLAGLVNYHPNYLNRIFYKSKGLTMHQYVINYRISIAEQLLITTSNRVGEIALNVGFTDISTFTENFKSKNHITPTEFRNKFGKVFIV